ncbi:hypothetical protein SAMN05444287_1678 [Octadecabacter temperatus]|uniref:Uncharacterized protein n=1 Tax=Octadecabacter temperatus TaxID=1458307 RepID=A0A0K0Y6N8_9RHOB|nr:hypothetical protein OSB_20220 [Octadecabacter temperatus]SIO16641.1 hypothetical protein SAMN05444287_1678 [Octadecabacter temperatus]
MGLIIVIGVIYLGGPLGLFFLLVGGIGMYRRKTPGQYGWPGLLLILGIILVLIAGYFAIELSNTNLGL